MNAVFFNEYIQTSPRFMTDFTPWTLFVDTGIISVLLLLGKLMRVKIRFIQRLFIPPSLLAGFIGLSLGPHGFYNPQIEMFAHFKTKSSFHKTKRII